jgi:hypothetical protein
MALTREQQMQMDRDRAQMQMDRDRTQMQMDRDRAMMANRNREAEARTGTPVDPARQVALERQEQQMRQQMEKYYAIQAQKLGITPEQMNELRTTPLRNVGEVRRYPGGSETFNETLGRHVNVATSPYVERRPLVGKEGVPLVSPDDSTPKVGGGIPKTRFPRPVTPDRQPYRPYLMSAQQQYVPDDGTLARMALERAKRLTKFGA